MAVTINTTTISEIDEAYPVAGIDNDTQGFRDNFSAIKDSLEAAAADLTALDSNTAKLDANNNFAGNQIFNAVLTRNTEDVNPAGNVGADQNISFENGHYQRVTATDDITLTLTDWPGDNASNRLYAKIRIVLSASGSSRDVTFAVSGGGTIKTDGDAEWSTNTITVATSSEKIIDFWTDDGGEVVYAHFVGEFS